MNRFESFLWDHERAVSLTLGILAAISLLAFYGCLAYVALHFLEKYW